MEPDLLYKISLSLIPGLGPCEAREMLNFFGSAEAIFNEKKLHNVPGINTTICKAIESRNVFFRAEQEIETIKAQHIHPFFVLDPDYPSRLQSCPDAPVMLYSRGNIHSPAQKVVSIVGTRHSSAYGRELTELLVHDLAENFPDTVIVSGLAYGIDICAHRAALKEGLPTIAVVAHGLQDLYPNVHRNTANEICQTGAVLTELPWGTPSEAWRFVQRNRIVAGLCDCCVVMESAVKGGSLITGRMARDYNREVFAYPGRPVDVFSKGCNLLIKQQTAALIESASDLFQEMMWETNSQNKKKQTSLFPELNSIQKHMMGLIKPGENVFINHLVQTSGLRTGDVLSLLTQLEMMGLIENLPGGAYRQKTL
jgi:DNA processing protein